MNILYLLLRIYTVTVSTETLVKLFDNGPNKIIGHILSKVVRSLLMNVRI